MPGDNGSDPAGFDLAGFRAAQAEATHETFTVTLGEHTTEGGAVVEGEHDVIEFPELRQWPIEAQTKFSEGDIVAGMTLLVGDKQAEMFRSYRWTFGEFEALFDALSKWSGFQTGTPSAQPRVPVPIRRSN